MAEHMAAQTDGGAHDPVAALLRDFPVQRVLITDDDEFIRCMLVELLCDTGLNLHQAQDGAQAVAMCGQTRYALVLMDMQMPGMAGVEATRRIRQLPGMAHIPILALTGSTSDADRSSCLQAGMSDFISKPIGADALAATVLHWLRRQGG
jgi:CheY-like chemotaxis protein